jgi:hypothetical protein
MSFIFTTEGTEGTEKMISAVLLFCFSLGVDAQPPIHEMVVSGVDDPEGECKHGPRDEYDGADDEVEEAAGFFHIGLLGKEIGVEVVDGGANVARAVFGDGFELADVVDRRGEWRVVSGEERHQEVHDFGGGGAGEFEEFKAGVEALFDFAKVGVGGEDESVLFGDVIEEWEHALEGVGRHAIGFVDPVEAVRAGGFVLEIDGDLADALEIDVFAGEFVEVEVVYRGTR